jgi:pyruvate dehydrogenase E1 component beta subunit
MSNIVTFTEAIRQGTEYCLQLDKKVFVMGLGVSYKNGADGTMGTLKHQFPNQVFDTPVSEFCNTGVCVGSAITGMRPIVHHARVEFALFASDQIITQAAKWNYMFGGNNPVPIVFRIAVGRQWGNGPQHTQSLYSLFGNVTGLKVVIPSSPYMAKGLLISAVKDNNPVVFLEPRWCYGLKEEIPVDPYELDISKSRKVCSGKDATLVCYGDGLVDALKAKNILRDSGITLDIIDLVSINPIDYSLIESSLAKTKKIFCLDTSYRQFSIGNQIIGELTSRKVRMDCAEIISCPNVPCPTSTSLTEIYYPTKIDIANKILFSLGEELINETMTFDELHLSPKIEIKYE